MRCSTPSPYPIPPRTKSPFNPKKSARISRAENSIIQDLTRLVSLSFYLPLTFYTRSFLYLLLAILVSFAKNCLVIPQCGENNNYILCRLKRKKHGIRLPPTSSERNYRNFKNSWITYRPRSVHVVLYVH